jgi:hypothetical protein
MPPSDDDYRAEALGAMIALVGQVDRAPHRTAALATARNIRALLARADQVLKQPGETDELHEMADAARARAIKRYGTSAWDEPETIEQAAARMGTLPATPEPSTYSGVPRPGPFILTNGTQYPAPPSPTDEELVAWAHLADQGHVEVRNTRHELLETRVETVDISASDLARLVAEVRRLRAVPSPDPRVPVERKPWQERMEAGEIPVVYGRHGAQLTDEELDVIEAATKQDIEDQDIEDIRRLAAEVRRLHSDEWVERAAEAYYGTHPGMARDRAQFASTVKKHRDGKA